MTTTTITCRACGATNLPGSRFCSTCATPLETAAGPPPESRKVVTVLFCDATSSTSLGERMDPESLRNLMTRYFDVMREVIEFHGGVVEKFIGDAVMAVFGVPVVHEDDALRACRAAVEIRDRLATLDTEIRADRGATVEWRMGINTGEVVAGDPNAGQRFVTGDAVNVAARLEGAAAPGEILLGADTYTLVRGAVAAAEIAPVTAKGKAEPVPAWRLEEVTEASARHGHARPLEAPLVGRRRPLRLLDEAFREAVEERICHLFTVLGVAGVGKSRLVEEFTAAQSDGAKVAEGRCLAYGHGITYRPVIEAVRDGAGIAESDSSDIAAARLGEILSGEPESERVAAVTGHLLGIGDAAPSPDEMFWAIRRTFEAMARRQPLILVFDDVHWGEPTFLDLIDHIAEWTRDAPILLIVMSRPELLEKRPTWGGGKHWATAIQLEPLSEDESETLVTELIGSAALPDEVRVQIGQAAEGNPLFVEELLGKLIDDGFLVQAGEGWAALGDLRQLAIPPTIQALLAARLDGLGAEDRAVIERASVEGKVFHRGAVTELAPEPMRPHVRDRLTSLMRMQLVRPDQPSFVGEEAYRFRHLLIRDAAYQALAKQSRAELHQRFAAWLERVAADRRTEYEEIIGYHLEQAYRYRAELGPPDALAHDLAVRGGTLLADAGERAFGRGDVTAAVDLLGRATELLPRDSARRRSLLPLLGNALSDAGNLVAAEKLLADAVAEADEAGDERARARAALFLANIRNATQSTEGPDALAEMDRQEETLRRLGDEEGTRLAAVWKAFVLFASGHAGQAVEGLRPVLAEGSETDIWWRDARGQLTGALVWGPIPISEALDELEGAIQAGTSDRRSATLIRAAGYLHAHQGDFDLARVHFSRARRAYQEAGERWQGLGLDGFMAGPAEWLAGNLSDAATITHASFQAMVAGGDRAFASTVAANLGEILLDVGKDEDAWRYATISRDTSSSDDVVSQAMGRAIQARVHSRRGDHSAAEALAREAVTIMSRTDYLTQHGDTLRHLAHVLREAGKESEAIEIAGQALSLYERKGATVLAERVRQTITEWDR